MKKQTLSLFLLPIIGSVVLLGSCGGGGSNTSSGTSSQRTSSSADEEADFELTYHNETVKDGETLDPISVGEKINQLVASVSNVTFASSDTAVLTIDANNGYITPVAAGSATITATHTTTGDTISVKCTVSDPTTPSGVVSYSTASSEEKTKILATLEKYAVDNYLTGITMFSNGSYVCYNDRYVPAATEYVSGYGWGTMREGRLTSELTNKEVTHPDYYNVGTSSLPTSANAMDASGSDVSSFAGYITSSYYGNRLNATGDGYEWTPVLATADCNRPVAIGDDENPNGATLNRRWRIYVRTGSSAPKYAIASTKSNVSGFNGRSIELEDYLTPFRFMLTNYNGQYRGSELTDGTSGITGAAEYFAATTNNPGTSEWWDEDAWKEYMTDTKNLFVGTDSTGDYIEFNLLYPCTQFYAMYYLSSYLYSPIPESFIDIVGTNFGASTSDTNPVDNTISCGPYTIETWSANDYICIKRNTGYHITSETLSDGTTRQLYQIPGFAWKYISSQNTVLQQEFLAGKIDSYSPDKTALAGDFGVDSGTGSGMTWHRYQTKADANFKLNVNATTLDQWNEKFGTSGSVYPHSSSAVTDYEENMYNFFLSNKHFLNFLSYGMDRETICESRGMTPTQEYFSDNYLIDPENSVVYNDTAEHAAVLANRYNETYGYNVDAAKKELATAMEEVIVPNNSKLKTKNSTGMAGTKSNPYMVTVKMQWMNTGDLESYSDVFDSMTTIANEFFAEEYGGSYEFEVEATDGTADYQQVYNAMKQGEFQMGFGAISGGDLNPINFMEVLKSDNSSGFTLNWGPDTSEVSDDIVYDGKKWSYDGLWSAADTAAVLDTNGNLAEIANVSTNGTGDTKYVSLSGSGTSATVVYQVSFESLIQAGAVLKTLEITNGETSESVSSDDTTLSGTAFGALLSSITTSNPSMTLTLGSAYNTVSGAECRITTLKVTYEVTVNGNSLSVSSSIKLPTALALA